jgi:transcriptional regulator with XRE-family HTH domain
LINLAIPDILEDIIMVIKYLNDHYNVHSSREGSMVTQRTYSRYAQEAALLLGKQIKLGRKQRKWSEKNLAERVGISRATLQKIENGELTCAIGLVFEAAALVGITLFEHDRVPLAVRIEQANDKITLLPQRVRAQTKVADDDF